MKLFQKIRVHIWHWCKSSSPLSPIPSCVGLEIADIMRLVKRRLGNTIFAKVFKSDTSNTIELDGVPCEVCQQVPPTKRKLRGQKVVTDRSGRVDCDASNGEERQLVTFCKDCYWKVLSETQYATTET